MNIFLIKAREQEDFDSNYLKEIVIVNLDNILLFPVQIVKKTQGDYLCVLPKRDRSYENGVDTEYIVFKDIKTRDNFLDQIISEYKKNNFYTVDSISSIPAEKMNFEIKFKKIEARYVKSFFNIVIDKKITIKGFKIVEVNGENFVTSPNFMIEKDLYNRFKVTNEAKNKIINEYISYTM